MLHSVLPTLLGIALYTMQWMTSHLPRSRCRVFHVSRVCRNEAHGYRYRRAILLDSCIFLLDSGITIESCTSVLETCTTESSIAPVESGIIVLESYFCLSTLLSAEIIYNDILFAILSYLWKIYLLCEISEY